MSGSPFILTFGGGSLRSDFDGCVGFSFTAPASNPPLVYELARWKTTGNSASHTVSLLNSSFAVVASVVLDMTLGSNESFMYGEIAPYQLAASSTYYVLSSEVNGGDQWQDESAITSDSGMVTALRSNFQAGCTGAVNFSAVLSCYAPVNIKVGPPIQPSYPHNMTRRVKVGTGMSRSDSAT